MSRDRKAIGIDGLPMTQAPVWPLHDIHNPLDRLARLATRLTLCLPAWVEQGRHGDPLRARLTER
ncbi:hypothetical protein IT41_18275 [Paracoccus halophilus]|uniref:Uncharacterized protein n=1 Tax=Paracoccus halophilus TaxID=376733 RepID=A0A099EVW6_9RHOB|nr:hypothetical protein [Paracoccus halophilus]KGJ02166.1 hypothetical protein IT41_18275 [Paracoccus halophilus]